MTKEIRLQTIVVALAGLLACSPALPRDKSLNGFDVSESLVPAREIRSGGPGRDGIPALLNPDFVTARKATFLGADDRVIGLQLGGVAKAYPIRILNYHEIVNDRVGSTPVAVTFCPLCGTGVVFRADPGGQPRTFGVSGLLYNSNVLLYDHQSESLWSQLMYQAISGPARGARLTTLPAEHTTWGAWRQAHPDTLVLEPPRTSGRNYDVDPYPGYATSARIWSPVSHQDKRYPSKAVIVGVLLGDTAKAYPFVELPTGIQRIDDVINDTPITLEYDHASTSARVLDASGDELPSVTAYWFAWFAFHPETLVYQNGIR
ncbi:MAG: DUF3179 domain-containing protein [Gammaproteobacteria bacterium]